MVELTRRELEVLQGMADGLGRLGTGRVLYLDETTVAKHLRNVYRKLGVHNAAHAIATAFRLGWLR